jgi:hypothetical protein
MNQMEFAEFQFRVALRVSDDLSSTEGSFTLAIFAGIFGAIFFF